MNILDELKKLPSPARIRRVTSFAGSSPSRFSVLVDAFMNGPYRITQRASGPLNNLAKTQPSLFRPHLGRLIHHAANPGVHNSFKRNMVRLLQFIDIPARLEGRVSMLCFAFLTEAQYPVALKVFSMTVLAKLAARHPELRTELRIILEDLLPYASAGVTSRTKATLKRL